MADQRVTLNFNCDWKFIKADPAGASAPGFNDSSWQIVSAPHTFNDADTFDDWSVPGHIGETNQWSGRTWYRKAFVLPETFRQKRIYLEFEAVRQVAEVYMNGRSLGTNRTGFIPFGFDLTPLLAFGGATNVLAVMADNRFTFETDMGKIALTELPWNSPHWHPAHGGIYRNVYLHVTDPLHISLPLYSNLKTAGPYIYSANITARSADVSCEVPLQNDGQSEETVSVQVQILDRDRKVLASLEKPVQVGAGEKQAVTLSGSVADPQLWEPAYPYLYTAVCRLKRGGGLVDNCEISFGIRTARWDVAGGFFINDRPIKLHGWGQKPTSEWPGLGAAHPDWMHYYDLKLMQEAGGNLVRWGHCAGAPADITSADRLGLIVLQPGVDGEGDAVGEAWKLRATAFRDMVIYFRNHPSIVLWEGGNQKVTREHAQELVAHMKAWDPHGGRAYAHRRADQTTGRFMQVDIGTEGGRQVPTLPVVEGEYNREEGPRRVWDKFSPPNFGYPEAQGQTYQLTSEEYAVNQVAQYVRKLGAANHSGGANWIFSDSTSGGRVSCEVARVSGEVDAMRLPKEAYYVCQTMFRDDPQVHIIGHWNYAAGTRKAIYVTSNCEEVELFLNDKSLGRGAVSDRHLFTFAEVGFERGELKAVAYQSGKVVATQTKHTVGEPVALRLTPITGPAGLQADGADVALVDVEAVDEKGQRCPTVQQRVDFELVGAAVWRGGYNSGKTNSVGASFLDLECGINRVAVRSTRVPGQITLSARSGKLRPASITLSSEPIAVAHGGSEKLPALPVVAQLIKPAPPASETSGGDVSRPIERVSAGSCLRTFSYSGPTTDVRVRQGARDGARIYADREYLFSGLPDVLRGCDWIQTANADNHYAAVDLMELSAATDGTIYVAHDDALARPDWLQRLFKPSDFSLAVEGRPMKVFTRHVRNGESLTLGSNANDRTQQSCNMYVVFVKRDGGAFRAGS